VSKEPAVFCSPRGGRPSPPLGALTFFFPLFSLHLLHLLSSTRYALGGGSRRSSQAMFLFSPPLKTYTISEIRCHSVVLSFDLSPPPPASYSLGCRFVWPCSTIAVPLFERSLSPDFFVPHSIALAVFSRLEQDLEGTTVRRPPPS